MKQERESRRAIVDRFLETLRGPSATPDQLDESRERIRQLVLAELHRRAEDRASGGTAPAPAARRRLWLGIPATAAVAISLVVCAVFFLRVAPTKIAVVDKNEPCLLYTSPSPRDS